MAKQFQRQYKLIVGHESIKIEDLDIEFEIIRTITREPNIAEITIFGLRERTSQSIIDDVYPPVSFWAGYKDKISLIFLGDARDCFTEKLGVENLTHINSGDTERKLRTTRINKTFKVGTPVVTVLKEIIKTLGISPGNIGTKFSALTLLEGSASYINGITLSGNANKQLSRVLKSCGQKYSIQNNVLQVLAPGESTLESPVILVRDNLIGSPEIGSDNTTKFTTLLDPEITPGRLVSMGGKLLRAERCRYYGQRNQNDWYVEVEGKYK